MNGFSLPSPAKLNLFLHITGRRPDGYHTLQTVFALLDHGDVLHFAPSDTLSLQVDGAAPVGDDNLVLRAARALQGFTDGSQGASIRLEKRLPMGGGVGGGSSNAATALLGLDHLWGLNLGIDRLAEIALALGADVPVFVRGRSAWAEGVGEQLIPVSCGNHEYLVVHPGVSISTGMIFGDTELTRDTPKSRVAAFLEPGSERHFRNDCEAIARKHFPAVSEALEWLRENAGNARMTGTGACVFARVGSRKHAEELLLRLPAHWKGFVARSVDESPTHQALAALRNAS